MAQAQTVPGKDSYSSKTSLPEHILRSDWDKTDNYQSIEPLRWESGESILVVEYHQGCEDEYKLKHRKGRFGGETLAEGQEEVAKAVNRILG